MNQNITEQSIARVRLAYQISAILPPLIEAVEMQKNAQVVRDGGVSAEHLAVSLFDSASYIVQHFASKRKFVIDQKLMLPDLLAVLSKSLRNSLVMFGNVDLQAISDDLIAIIEGSPVIDRWVMGRHSGDTINPEMPFGSKDPAIGYGLALSEVSAILLPIMLFHNTLFVVGRVNMEQLAKLNADVSDYVGELVICLWDKLSENNKEIHASLAHDMLFMCSEVIRYHFKDIEKKIVKKESDIDAYINNPSAYWDRITPGIASSFATIDSVTKKIMSRLQPGL